MSKGIASVLKDYTESMAKRYSAENRRRARVDEPAPGAPVDPVALGERAMFAHCQDQESRLRAMVPKTYHLSGSHGPRCDPQWIKGLNDLLTEQKRACGVG